MIEDNDDYEKAKTMLDLLFHHGNNKNMPNPDEPATDKQIYFLIKNDVKYDEKVTKKQASELIDHYIKTNSGGSH